MATFKINAAEVNKWQQVKENVQVGASPFDIPNTVSTRRIINFEYISDYGSIAVKTVTIGSRSLKVGCCLNSGKIYFIEYDNFEDLTTIISLVEKNELRQDVLQNVIGRYQNEIEIRTD